MRRFFQIFCSYCSFDYIFLKLNIHSPIIPSILSCNGDLKVTKRRDFAKNFQNFSPDSK